MTAPRQARQGTVHRSRLAGVALAVTVLAGTLVLAMPPASAALTSHQRQIAVGADAVSSSTFSLTVPAGVSTTVGRHLVVAYLFSGAGTNAVTGITDTKGNSYSINAVKKNSGTTGLLVVVASAKVTAALGAGDTVTVTQNAITTYHLMQVYEFDNFDPTSWVDQSASASTTGTAVSTPATATTAQAGETLFAAVGYGDTSATLTSASGWSDAAKVEASGTKIKSLGVAAKDVSATGAYAYAGTLSASEQWVAVLVTFKTVAAPPPPTASFSATPTSGTAPLTVQFTDTSTGSPTAWSWDFGDGGSSTTQNPSHAYTAAGTFTVALTASNAGGSDTATRTALISVTAPPSPPTASFSATPTSGTAPLTVQFTDTSTGSPTAWSWDFGDGGSSTTQNPSHAYTAAGTFTVALTASNAGGSDTATRTGLISVSSASPDTGYEDGSTSGAGSAATGEKPESKLWWNDGSWWASMLHAASQTYHIFRLDRPSQTWVDTGTLIDNRPKSRSDTLWDGSRLYVASHVFASSSSTAASGNPARLYRFSYSPATKTYSLDAGFPAQISNYSAEALTIDKDSAGVLWATWTQGSQVYVNNTTGGDAVWGTPFVMPTSGATGLHADDISAVAAFGGNKVGVMWSNQAASAMYFAVHADGSAPGSWGTSRTAVQGPSWADDHINLKQLEGDSAGRIFAAVKTSLNDVGSTTSAPQIMVLARDPATGDWSSYVFGRISDCHTRPVLVIDSQHQVLHVFATAPDSGCPFSGSPGTIFEKTSPLSNIAFAAGRGTPVIRDADSANLNNVTTTKQSVTGATGLVVLASNDVTKRYWHADIPLGG